MGNTTLFICGLLKEKTIAQQIAQGKNSIVLCGAGVPSNIGNLLKSVDPTQIGNVISFGICGGLNPAFRPGHVVVPHNIGSTRPLDVVVKNGPTPSWIKTDLKLQSELSYIAGTAGFKTHSGTVIGSDQLVGSASQKAALRQSLYHGDVVDNESHLAASFALTYGIPFGALRIVCDPASQSLPRAALLPLNQDGSQNDWNVTKSILRRPWQLPGLIRLGLESGKAFRNLEKCADAFKYSYLSF